jgi:hypothetical protein
VKIRFNKYNLGASSSFVFDVRLELGFDILLLSDVGNLGIITFCSFCATFVPCSLSLEHFKDVFGLCVVICLVTVSNLA